MAVPVTAEQGQRREECSETADESSAVKILCSGTYYLRTISVFSAKTIG